MTATAYQHDLAETWHQNIDQCCDGLEDSASDAGVSAPKLRMALETLLEDAIAASARDWEPGAACPHCESTIVTRFSITEETTRHENGEVHFEAGSPLSIVVMWACVECDSSLAVSPTALALTVEPSRDYEIDTALQAVLEAAIPDTGWAGGEPCSECGHSYMVESPVDVEFYQSKAGDTHYDTSGDRLATVGHSCESCGRALAQRPAALLSRFFHL